MCLPSAPAQITPAPPPPPPPPPLAPMVSPEASKGIAPGGTQNSAAARASKSGRKSLRIDLGGTDKAASSGLNIPS